jgi:hypothetical protein
MVANILLMPIRPLHCKKDGINFAGATLPFGFLLSTSNYQVKSSMLIQRRFFLLHLLRVKQPDQYL